MKKGKVIISIMIMTMMVEVLLPLFASAEEEINLNLTPASDIDIVMSLGQTSRDMSGFESDIKRELRQEGIDTSRVNVQAVETAENDLQSSFSWHRDVSSRVGSINLQNSGSRIQMYGNRRNEGFNKIYTTTNDTDIKEQKISFSYDLEFGDSFDGAGVLFNVEQLSHGKINGYALMFTEDGEDGNAHLFRLRNWEDSYGKEIFESRYRSYRDVEDNSLDHEADYLGSKELGTSGSYDLEITEDRLKIYRYNSYKGSFNLPTKYGWGFGFFSDHYSHSCSRIGQFSLDNIEMETTKAKEFTEVIRQPEWREGSKRFLVNIDERKVNDFENETALGEIMPRLSNENIHFIGYGNSTNKGQMEDIIDGNNGNGDFYSLSNYSSAVDKTAKYIKNTLDALDSGDEYVLVGEPVDIDVTPKSLMTNTATSEYPQGRWRIDHDYDYFDNNMGQASWANQWQEDLLMVFDRPGRYEVGFEDSHPDPRYIYAHRRPVANYSLDIRRQGSRFQIRAYDYSYDPDSEYSDPDKGIAEKDWKWREVSDSSWNNGKIPEDLSLGNDYIVQLRVKDDFGVWSTPVQRYVTTESVATKPISSFSISPNPVSKYGTLTYEDVSYDPAGDRITNRQWTVRKDGNVIHSGSSPKTEFLSHGEGNYTISLKVKNESNLWSEEFTRPLQVTKDIDKPEAIINPTNKDWTSSSYEVKAEFSDKGDSGFKHQRYVVTDHYEAPNSGWSSWSSSKSRDIRIDELGEHYVHLQAYDNEGNLMERSSGPYKFDDVVPNNPRLELSSDDWEADVTFKVTASGDVGSGVDRVQYKIEGDNWKNVEEGKNESIPNKFKGEVDVRARVIDNVGNISSVVHKVAKIDDKPPVVEGIQLENGLDNAKLTVDAEDKESGIAGYRYYIDMVTDSEGFKRVTNGWVGSNSFLFDDLDANRKYRVKAELKDNNGNIVETGVGEFVTAPDVTFSGQKDGDFANTATIEWGTSGGGKHGTEVEIYREGKLWRTLDKGTKFKDENLDYERSYDYELITKHGSLESKPYKVFIEIGSPELEFDVDKRTYYRTPFDEEVDVYGIVRFRQGADVEISILGETKVVNVDPYETENWVIPVTVYGDERNVEVKVRTVDGSLDQEIVKTIDIEVKEVDKVDGYGNRMK